MSEQEKVKTKDAVFEDLIADFIIEEGREPDIEEMAWMAGAIATSIRMGDFYAD